MVIYLLVVSICIALISRVFWQHNICIFNILEFNTVISENAFSWHPKSEKWFCQGLVHTVPKDSCPSGTRPMEMYELVLGKTHFSDFGCQEKAFSEITVLNFKILKLQLISIYRCWNPKYMLKYTMFYTMYDCYKIMAY